MKIKIMLQKLEKKVKILTYYAFASTVLCVFSLIHVGAGYVDYLNIVHLLRLPADSKIQISGAKIYWM